MPIIDGQELPALNSSGAFIHKLSGSPPEYQLEPRLLLEGSGYMKGCKVLETSGLSAEDSAQIVAILSTAESYGDQDMGARCFFPGFAFSFGTGEQLVHVQVCLECSWVVFHSNASSQSFVPSAKGETQLRAVYERLVA